MKRKIIKQGHNTLTITLPSNWAKKFSLAPGSEIELTEKDNGLLISTEQSSSLGKTEINIDNMDIPTIWKYLMGIYREGYDEVKITFSPSLKLESPYKFFAQHKEDIKYKKEKHGKGPLDFFHELVNRFIGFEITSHGEGFIIIREMSEATSKEFENSLRRVFFLIQQMAEETCKALSKNKPELLTHIHDVDVNLDKFHDYCIRILNKKGNREYGKPNLIFSMLYLLELLGDEYKNISHHLLQDFSEKSNLKNLKEMADSVKEQIDHLYTLYYKFDKELVLRISEIDKKRYFNVKALYKKTETNEEKEIFHHLRIITRYINAITELIIELAISPEN